MASKPPLLKRALRVLLWLGVILLGLLIAGAFVADRVLRSKYEPVIAQIRKQATENVDFFCEQQALLAADPWFHEPRTEGDAGPLLNAWVQWEGMQAPPKDSPLLIPAQLPQKVGDFKDWLTSSVDVSTLDFGWMEKLHAYDRWDIVKNGPGEPHGAFNMATATIPNFVGLQLWAKFRLLHGLRTGQPLQAARDVRHLAWLMYRTDTLVGAAVASTLLQAESDAVHSLQSPPVEWKPMSAEQVARMRALVMSSLVFSNIAVPPEVARKARTCGEPAVTGCIGLAESGFLTKYLKPLAQDLYREAYTSYEQEIGASPCPTSLARMVWERGVTIEDHIQEKEMPDQPDWMRHLPRSYFGHHIAGILIAIGTPSVEKLETFRKALAAGDFKKQP